MGESYFQSVVDQQAPRFWRCGYLFNFSLCALSIFMNQKKKKPCALPPNTYISLSVYVCARALINVY